MPQFIYHKDSSHAIAIWRITESETELCNMLPAAEATTVAHPLAHPVKRLEVLAARILTISLLQAFNQQFNGIMKDEHGKPLLIDLPFHLSQSHSYPYVAVIVSSEKNVGIDIEQPRATLSRVGHRVFNDIELAECGTDLTKLCLHWCAKETLIKLYGKKDLALKEELFIRPFTFQPKGTMTGIISRKGHEKSYELQYLVEDDFVLVHN